MVLTSLLNFIKFDTGNLWVIIPQVVSIIALIWFVVHSTIAFYREAKTEHARTQGAMSVLGFVYMIFSGGFIGLFIYNFDKLRSINEWHLRNSLDPRCDNPYWYVLFINVLTVLILIGFTLNFSKALLTLTLLEFGALSDQKLGVFLNSKGSGSKPYVEPVLRLFIALLFVLTEKHLAGENIFATFDSGAADRKFNSFLAVLGILSFLLYFLLLIWLLMFYCWLDKERRLSSHWYNGFFKQFLAGIVVSVFFILFSWDNIPGELYKIILTVFLFAGIGAALTIIVTVTLNEWRRLSASPTQINGIAPTGGTTEGTPAQTNGPAAT